MTTRFNEQKSFGTLKPGVFLYAPTTEFKCTEQIRPIKFVELENTKHVFNAMLSSVNTRSENGRIDKGLESGSCSQTTATDCF